MIRRPPRSTRTDTLFPYTTLFRSVFRMTGARASATTSAAPNGDNIDAQNLTVPAEAGAIAKAITGAYLSSGGNAFSTRTASMIVQQHFPPAPTTVGLESGRSEKRSVGQECVRTCRSRGAPDH